ncbi:hypothetical protein SAMN05216345_1386 [Cupriavidus sp. YR651]|uniref:hypothetical protein n=1 Tax=Cupriavidus sp. YR651 TaxID=1855315 RepID=UPI00087E0F11|nr:hypothetical protein [Cupriavidus sp. YR651]SDE03990.1 hypothetical protein SAMN05216345_1386 [Cupriavidus sp. YR651]
MKNSMVAHSSEQDLVRALLGQNSAVESVFQIENEWPDLVKIKVTICKTYVVPDAIARPNHTTVIAAIVDRGFAFFLA